MPSVTPEMVEKARLWLLEHGFKGNTVIMAEFAASAVQDAVSELLPAMGELEKIITDNFHCSPADNCAECEIYRPIIVKAAALREKYGVKP